MGPTLRADMHAHTRYSGWRHLRFIHPRDCYTDPLDLYRGALARGMDLVAVTDHDTVEGALRLLDAPGVDPARVLVGEEVECRFPETGQWVHVNVYGLSVEDHRHLAAVRGDVRQVVACCKERALLHVLNHPFQSWRGQKPLEAYLEDLLELFSHVEGLNGAVPALQNRAVGSLCARAATWGRRLIQVGGSDAHVPRRVGRAWTQAPAADAPGFLAAVRDGRCTVGGEANTTPGLLRDVTEVVGTYYARLYAGRGEAPTRATYALDLAFATASLAAVATGVPAWVVLGSQARQKLVSLVVLRGLPNLAPMSAPAYNPLSD